MVDVFAIRREDVLLPGFDCISNREQQGVLLLGRELCELGRGGRLSAERSSDTRRRRRPRSCRRPRSPRVARRRTYQGSCSDARVESAPRCCSRELRCILYRESLASFRQSLRKLYLVVIDDLPMLASSRHYDRSLAVAKCLDHATRSRMTDDELSASH